VSLRRVLQCGDDVLDTISDEPRVDFCPAGQHVTRALRELRLQSSKHLLDHLRRVDLVNIGQCGRELVRDSRNILRRQRVSRESEILRISSTHPPPRERQHCSQLTLHSTEEIRAAHVRHKSYCALGHRENSSLGCTPVLAVDGDAAPSSHHYSIHQGNVRSTQATEERVHDVLRREEGECVVGRLMMLFWF